MTARCWEVSLPIAGKLRDVALSSNYRLHWREQARRTGNWRSMAAVTTRSLLAMGSLPRGLSLVQIDADFYLPGSPKRMDVGNLYPTVKAIVDGIVDSKLIPDDDDQHVRGPFLHRVMCDKDYVGHRRVVIRVTDLGVGHE